MEPMLELKNVTVHYGKAIALDDVSLSVDEAEIVTMIGSNGAGKSTTLRVIAGLVRPTNGEVWFEGQRIDRNAPEKMATRISRETNPRNNPTSRTTPIRTGTKP